MPGYPAAQARADIERLVHAAAADPRLRGARLAVEFQGFMADGCTFPADQPISRLVAACHRQVTGEEVRLYNATGLTDARHYVLHGGTRATCYGPDGDSIHGIDESVGLAELHQTTRVIALLVARWCGVERIGL